MTYEENTVWSLYASDAVQALSEIEQSLLALESDESSSEQINRLYRALHTLKGNSALLELKRIETLAHAAEDVVGVVREGRASMDQSTVDLMLSTVDVLRAVVEQVAQTRRDVEASAIQARLDDVRAWLSARGETPREHGPPAGSVGGVLLFSDQPATPSIPSLNARATPAEDTVDADTLGLFLRLAKNLCLPSGRLLSTTDELNGLIDVLLPGAERLGFLALARALNQLSRGPGRSQTPVEPSELSVVCSVLSELEASYRRLCVGGETFGFAELLTKQPLVELPAAHAKTANVLLIGDSSPVSSATVSALRARISGLPARKSGLPARKSLPPKVKRSAPPKRIVEPNQVRSQVLRVDASKVSCVMDLAGEIGLACSAVTHHPDLEGRELEGFAAAAHKLEVLVRELQNEVSALRLVPISTVFQLMQRVVRDTARRTNKQVELVVAGEDTEIDKVMVDALHDPLVHLLRNAIDHGIELPAERAARGKPSTGRIRLEASHQGGEVLVSVSDDGRGLDRTRIVRRAKERGLIADGVQLTDSQILELIFLPGFSTKDQIDELSGRGVGMDVIKTSVEALRGRVRLGSTEGKGSSVALTVPLTMAFLDAMVVRDGGLLYALPIEKVCEVFKVQPAQVCKNSADGRVMLRVRNELVPILRLGEFYGRGQSAPVKLVDAIIVVVQTASGALALPVDALLGNQPVMLKPLRGVIATIRAAAGCGMLRSGDVALTIDCERLHAQ